MMHGKRFFEYERINVRIKLRTVISISTDGLS